MLVEANGGRIHCAIGGSGPPLLVPGYASTPMFDQIVELFGADHTVIGHDVRGEGLETHFAGGPYSLWDLADDSAAVLEHFGFERAHYLGHSHTGSLGLALALRHPDRVDRLILTVTGPGSPPADQDAVPIELPDGLFTADIVAAEQGNVEAIRRLSSIALSTAAVAQAPELVEEIANGVFTKVFAQPAAERAHMWAAYAQFNVRDRLSEITSPTLVVTSDADRMVDPAQSWFMWNEIPDAVLVALHGMGHAWLTEAPELVAGFVRAFLAGRFEPSFRITPT